jgi:hypothetical protein
MSLLPGRSIHFGESYPGKNTKDARHQHDFVVVCEKRRQVAALQSAPREILMHYL